MTSTRLIFLSLALLNIRPITAFYVDKLPKTDLQLPEFSSFYQDKKGKINPIHFAVILVAIPKSNALDEILKFINPETKKTLINAVNTHGETPLMLAIKLERAKIISTLISHGANPNLLSTFFYKNYKLQIRPIHRALFCKKTKCLQELLKHGANINSVDSQGRTALIQAITSQRNIHTQFLLAQGANPNYCKDENMRPLTVAFEHNYPAVFTLLRYDAKLNNHEKEKLILMLKITLSRAIHENNAQDFCTVIGTISHLNLIPHEELEPFCLTHLAKYLKSIHLNRQKILSIK